jgi:Protein of unknown function (DUF3426)
VRQEHVRAHAGLVRCGACRGIFDARMNLIEGHFDDDGADNDTFGAPQTIMAGVPAGKPLAPTSEAEIRAAALAAIAPKPNASPPSVIHKPSSETYSGQAVTAQTHPDATASSLESVHAKPVAGDIDYSWKATQKPLSRRQKIAYALLSVVAAIILLAQSAYWFRDELVSRYPSLSTTFAAACTHLGCRISPPRRPEGVGFVGTELAPDPAHKGLYIFSATLRNEGSHSVAFPSLILTFDGASGEILARKVFSPEQYAPANANLAKGLDGGADIEIKLYLDVSPAVPVGFKAERAYF